MIQINNISKHYGSIAALSDVSLSMKRGELIGLLGVNGAGKSTLMKILVGIVQPDSGQFNFFGQDSSKISMEIKQKTGYLSEDNPLYEDMYVKEYLNYVRAIYKIPNERLDWVIQHTGLEKEYKNKIKTLSKGNRQRVGIAQALIHDPIFLIMDEPTTGLDPNQRDSLNRLFVELSKEKIILFSTHILHDVKEICTRCILLDKGKKVADQPVDQIESIENLFHTFTNENNSR